MSTNMTTKHSGMPAASHTPGPWLAHQESHGLFISANSYCIAKLGDGNSPAAQDDARLIAAAPDLLAALREAEVTLTVLQPHNRYMDGTIKPGPSDLLVSIRAAIAKAEGV